MLLPFQMNMLLETAAVVVVPGTTIANATATTDSGRYEVCARSGRKALPGELIQEAYTKLWVLREYSDPYPEQIRVRVSAESLTGALKPEASDVFITTSVSAEDL